MLAFVIALRYLGRLGVKLDISAFTAQVRLPR